MSGANAFIPKCWGWKLWRSISAKHGSHGKPICLAEHFRETRQSWKADLSLNGSYVIELFSFPSPPPRPSYPEAVGLRHLAFEVDDIEAAEHELTEKGIAHEPIRTDEYTHKRFVFFSDPDDLPIELYER